MNTQEWFLWRAILSSSPILTCSSNGVSWVFLMFCFLFVFRVFVKAVTSIPRDRSVCSEVTLYLQDCWLFQRVIILRTSWVHFIIMLALFSRWTYTSPRVFREPDLFIVNICFYSPLSFFNSTRAFYTSGGLRLATGWRQLVSEEGPSMRSLFLTCCCHTSFTLGLLSIASWWAWVGISREVWEFIFPRR